MKRTPFAIVLVVSSAWLTGCPAVVGVVESASYPKDIHEADWVPPAPQCKEPGNCIGDIYVDECQRLSPAVIWQTQNFSSQQIKYVPVEHLTATCSDPSCEASVQGQTVIVHGKSVGSSHVRIAYDHPVTHAHFEHLVEIPFRDPPPADTLRPQMERPAGYKCPVP